MLLAKRKHVKQSFKVISEHFGLWWLCGRGATKDLRAHQQHATLVGWTPISWGLGEKKSEKNSANGQHVSTCLNKYNLQLYGKQIKLKSACDFHLWPAS